MALDAGRILLVDDSFIARHGVKILLSAENFEILEAKGGDEALELIERERPDLILLDLLMPQPDGIAVLKELQQKDGPPVIILSADIQQTTRERCFELGAVDFIRKPPKSTDLIASIREQLG